MDASNVLPVHRDRLGQMDHQVLLVRQEAPALVFLHPELECLECLDHLEILEHLVNQDSPVFLATLVPMGDAQSECLALADLQGQLDWPEKLGRMEILEESHNQGQLDPLENLETRENQVQMDHQERTDLLESLVRMLLIARVQTGVLYWQ